MWPRYRPGRRVAVSPAAPVSIGDDVLVGLAAGGEASIPGLIKELVSRSGSSLKLRQFTPDMSFEVSQAEVAFVYKVMGEIY